MKENKNNSLKRKEEPQADKKAANKNRSGVPFCSGSSQIRGNLKEKSKGLLRKPIRHLYNKAIIAFILLRR